MTRANRLLILAGLLSMVVAAAGHAGGLALTPGGVAYRDLQVGSGEPVNDGDVVTVQLSGWVDKQGSANAAFLDTRREGHPLKFLVGTPQVMPGWNEGVRGMRVGGRRLLRIPPEMGLGARSFEDAVSANATLVFLVELLDVRPAQQ